MPELWNRQQTKVYRDAEGMRNKQKCTGSKSFSILQGDVEGHTKFLQGINLQKSGEKAHGFNRVECQDGEIVSLTDS